MCSPLTLLQILREVRRRVIAQPREQPALRRHCADAISSGLSRSAAQTIARACLCAPLQQWHSQRERTSAVCERGGGRRGQDCRLDGLKSGCGRVGDREQGRLNGRDVTE